MKTAGEITSEAAEAAIAGDLERLRELLDHREDALSTASTEDQAEAYRLGVALATLLRSSRNRMEAESEALESAKKELAVTQAVRSRAAVNVTA